MIKEYLLKKLADVAFERISEALKSGHSQCTSSLDDLETALQLHLREVRNWSSEISFSDLRSAKSTRDAFIPLDLLLQPRRLRLEVDEQFEIRPLEEVLDKTKGHIIILGQPGAGKTTSMKHLCQRLLSEESFMPDSNFPILIRLRELKKGKSVSADDDGLDGDILLTALEELLGIDITYPPLPIASEARQRIVRRQALANRRLLHNRAIIEYIDSLTALIILDGLDEIQSLELREIVVASVRQLANQLDESRIILTSRTGEFQYHIESMAQFEIHPLTNEQIKTFTIRWLGPEDGEQLVRKIRQSPFSDVAIRPLTIAHLCAIYERMGSIPERPKTIYRRIVILLLEKWDEQRSVKRVSAYARFDTDRKLEFLAQLAFTLTDSFHSTVFSRRDLIDAYRKIYDNYALPLDEADHVAREIESHTGLLLESGADMYEFSHKSLQEYLAAEFIVRLPSMPHQQSVLVGLPNELAIATAISSRPSEYLAQLVLERFQAFDPPLSFLRSFVARLLLERPDFEESSRVGSALLGLHSKFLYAILREGVSDIEQEKASDKSFDVLCELIRARIRASDILDVFRIEETLKTQGNQAIVRMAKMTELDYIGLAAARDNLRQDLPSMIWVSPSLLS